MKISLLYLVLWCLAPNLWAKDPAMESIGTMSVQLLFATNDDPAVAGGMAKELPEAEIKKLKSIPELQFEHYRLMGVDTPDILKGYESWATPLRPSKEILVSFETIKRADGGRMQMVLQYWQGQRKMFTVNPTFIVGKPLYLLGPEWRKGRLILAVKIEKLQQ